jgi:hypothetical protein
MIHDATGPHFGLGRSSDDDSMSCSADPLRRAVHVLLAIYLIPAVLAVLLVGGLACVLGGIGRMILGANGDRRSVVPERRRAPSRIGIAYQPARRGDLPPLQPASWSESDGSDRPSRRVDSLAWDGGQGRRSRP